MSVDGAMLASPGTQPTTRKRRNPAPRVAARTLAQGWITTFVTISGQSVAVRASSTIAAIAAIASVRTPVVLLSFGPWPADRVAQSL